MALSPGTKIGHYDVIALLGEGGMGQGWQATETQLNRQVALKILPDAFAREHMANFKAPRKGAFADELPKTATGQIHKYLLRQERSAIATQ